MPSLGSVRLEADEPEPYLSFYGTRSLSGGGPTPQATAGNLPTRWALPVLLDLLIHSSCIDLHVHLTWWITTLAGCVLGRRRRP